MTPNKPRIIVGFDGSPGAVEAIEVGALLLPGARAVVARVWAPPFASPALRSRLWEQATSLDELMERVEREGLAEAERLVAKGVALATAAGWDAEPLVERNYGDDGFALARLAEQKRPAAVVAGARGLSGVRAVLGSVSDSLVHYSPVPVLVVPQPVLTEERAAAGSGPVVVGWDGSEGARHAATTAESLFTGRKLIEVAVGSEAEDAARPDGLERVEPHGVGQSGRAVADALAGYASDCEAAVVVVGSRGRSARRKILLGSVAMALLHHAHRPVLVVPGPDRFHS